MTDDRELDELIARLRARAADPERRTNVRQTEFGATVGSLDLGGLLSMGRGIAASLRDVVAANQAGRVDPAGARRAEELQRALTEPVPTVLPAPADAAMVEATEAVLGVSLPPVMRRVYMEVADGGFGPGEGILPLAMVVRTVRDLRRPDGRLPRGRTWPATLLPVVEMDPGYDCVDAETGQVIAWDPEELGERTSEDRFRRSFREIFPSVEAWLTDWLGSKTQAEQSADLMAQFMSPEYQARQARGARERIARMTPQQRAEMGLPEVGWEKVVWGGVGWEDDAGDHDTPGDPDRSS